MATASISQDQDTIQLEIHVAAPPERVFQALTDPHQLMQWWGQKGTYQPKNWASDVRVGGKWLCEGNSDDGTRPYSVGGEFIELDPPRLLAYTWVPSWAEGLRTTVRWDLTPAAGGTRVQLRHSGFATAPAAAKDHYQGWVRVAGWLQAFVEKGSTIQTRPSAGEGAL